jgi:hypothetical protein
VAVVILSEALHELVMSPFSADGTPKMASALVDWDSDGGEGVRHDERL